MKPFLFPLALGLASMLTLPSLAAADDAIAADPSFELVAKAADPDPAVHTDYGLTCTWNWACGGTMARLRWARTGASCWSDAVPDMPFTVILPGNGFHYDDYDHLQAHLARNGIASLAVESIAGGESSTDHQQVADETIAYLDSACFDNNVLDNFAAAQPIDFDRTAIVGHSRGGESARYLAGDLAFHPGYDVRAVVSMAPTRNTTQSMVGIYADAYLVLYGTGDADVPPVEPFAAHDLAGWNHVSTPNAWDLDRTMKLVQNISHPGYSDLGFGSHQVVTRGYVHAFLRRWLLADSQFYPDYVAGDLVPGGLMTAFSQTSDGIHRRTIDSFQHLALSPSTIGGDVLPFAIATAETVNAASLADTPHAGWVLRFVPDFPSSGMQWTIPEASADFRGYRYLSLRIGRLDGVGPEQATIWIRNANSWSSLDLGAYGSIPEITPMCVAGLNFCSQFDDLGHMRTIRIPLADFGAHDDVSQVFLRIGPDAIGETFIVDDLELTGIPMFVFE